MNFSCLLLAAAADTPLAAKPTFDSPIVLFVGLLAAVAALVHFGHTRHHELSQECWNLRDKIKKLLAEISTSTDVTKAEEMRHEARALMNAYDSVKERYHYSTRGAQFMPWSLFATVLVGLWFLNRVETSSENWFVGSMIALAPLIIGMAFIVGGDLASAAKAQSKVDCWFQSFCERHKELWRK